MVLFQNGYDSNLKVYLCSFEPQTFNHISKKLENFAHQNKLSYRINTHDLIFFLFPTSLHDQNSNQVELPFTITLVVPKAKKKVEKLFKERLSHLK